MNPLQDLLLEFSLSEFLGKETESLGALKLDANNVMVWRKPLRAYDITKFNDLAKCSFSLFDCLEQ